MLNLQNANFHFISNYNYLKHRTKQVQTQLKVCLNTINGRLKYH